MPCMKCDATRRELGYTHRVGTPCDICDDTGVDYLGRPCRHRREGGHCTPPAR
jgi:hypothetical protein